jgi:hypothetical protein
MATITDSQLAAIQAFAAAFAAPTATTTVETAKKGPGRPRKEATVQAAAPAKVEPAKAVFDAAKLKAALSEKTIPVDIIGIGPFNMRADRWAAREAEQAKWYNDDGQPDMVKWAISYQAARIKACQLTGLDWTKFVK